MASKPTIVKIGYALVGLAFVSMLAVAVVATLEGSGPFAVSHQASGRPAVFMPVVYLPLLVAVVVVAAIWVFRRARKGEASNSTPHADARDVPPPAKGSGARAGWRERSASSDLAAQQGAGR